MTPAYDTNPVKHMYNSIIDGRQSDKILNNQAQIIFPKKNACLRGDLSL
jgi:hypothetical protein